MQGYWIPTDGTPRQKRRFVYLLKHPSRYEAYANWIHFTNDREWQKVLDMPEFSGLLAEKPTSIFMTENDYSNMVANKVKETGGVYELRTYTCNKGKLGALNARFRDHTTELFGKHRMKNIGYWTPFDPPESQNRLIYLIHHESREQSDANWKSFLSDPAWQSVARESQNSPRKPRTSGRQLEVVSQRSRMAKRGQRVSKRAGRFWLSRQIASS